MNDTDATLRVIGVAYDGSPEAQAALRCAAQLAVDAEAAVQVIGVFDYHVPAPAVGVNAMYAVPDGEEHCRDELLRALEDAAESLPPEVRAAVVFASGDPAEQLVKRADVLSLLVIGSRGYGPLRRALLGSVSARVLREASCPVLVVPRTAIGEPAAA